MAAAGSASKTAPHRPLSIRRRPFDKECHAASPRLGAPRGCEAEESSGSEQLAQQCAERRIAKATEQARRLGCQPPSQSQSLALSIYLSIYPFSWKQASKQTRQGAQATMTRYISTSAALKLNTHTYVYETLMHSTMYRHCISLSNVCVICKYTRIVEPVYK